jgi:hypothetical protein
LSLILRHDDREGLSIVSSDNGKRKTFWRT